MKKNQTNEPDNELKGILNVLESKTFKFIFFFSCIGILLIFAASILNTEENIYYEIANALNMFISIVVGVVAMVMSIISLFFSFYNTKQSYDTHNDYLEKFINISNSLDNTMKRQEEYISKLNTIDEKITEKFDKMYEMINSLDKTSFQQVDPKEPSWKEDFSEDDWDFGDLDFK